MDNPKLKEQFRKVSEHNTTIQRLLNEANREIAKLERENRELRTKLFRASWDEFPDTMGR